MCRERKRQNNEKKENIAFMGRKAQASGRIFGGADSGLMFLSGFCPGKYNRGI